MHREDSETPPGLDQPDVVLLIEPDALSRRSPSEALRTKQYSVSDVSSGAAGLGLLDGGLLPCLIVYVPSDGDDSQAFRAAQLAAPAFATMPIVLYSGDEARTVASDGDALPEPFRAALLTLVGRHCPQYAHVH